jgi:hypothetical protein
MRRELQAYLDGEISFHELPPELCAEAERWDRLLAEVREFGPAGAPADLEARVVRALPARRRRPTWRRAADWAIQPRPLHVSPLVGLAAAAALALIIVQPWRQGATPSQPPEGSATIYVQFVLEAPGASSVAVAGDFNGWTPELALSDPDGDGIWMGRIPLEPGLHQYMFVIDGSQWMTDPHAQRYADDGFGNRNAILVVTQPTARS